MELTNINDSQKVFIAEKRALSWILNNTQEAFENMAFDKEDFVHEDYQQVFLAIENLYTSKLPISHLGIVQQLADVSQIGVNDLKNIEALEKTSNISSLEDVTKELNIAKLKNKAYAKSRALADLVLNPKLSKSEIDDKIMDIVSTISLIDTDNPKKSKLQTLEEWLVDYREKFQNRKGKKQYPFGDFLMDKAIIRGAAPGTVGIISATTGMGKSTVVQYLQSCLEKVGVPSTLISLEMSGESQMDRRLADKYKIPFSVIANPTDTQDFLKISEIIENEIVQAKDNKTVMFSEDPTWTLADIRKETKQFQKKIGQEYCVIIIDLLTMLKEFTETRPGLNFAQSIEVSMNQLNALAKELNVHFIGTVQFGRKADSVKIMDYDDIQHCRPSLNDLKNSNALAERARYTIGLFRAKHYADRYLSNNDETQKMEDLIEFMVLKQNEGPVGSFSYLFDPETFTVVPVLGAESGEIKASTIEDVEDLMV